MRKEVVQYFCDRCKAEFNRGRGFFVEELSYTAGSYSPEGSGGCDLTLDHLCNQCSKQFYEWAHGRASFFPNTTEEAK